MSPAEKIAVIIKSNDTILARKTLNEINIDYIQNVASTAEKCFVAASMFLRGMTEKMSYYNLTYDDARNFLLHSNISTILMTTEITSDSEFINRLGKRPLDDYNIVLSEAELDIAILVIQSMIINTMNENAIGMFNPMISAIQMVCDHNPTLSQAIAAIDIPDSLYEKIDTHNVTTYKLLETFTNFSDLLDLYTLTSDGE